MTLARSALIDPDSTRFYHCTSRCVRRAFLCGKDPQTGYDFEHRRAWIENKLLTLATIFAIDVCSYAIMSNHYHTVLHINSEQSEAWSDEDVVERWGRIYRVPEWLELADETRRERTIAVWRERLGSISWFMKYINERLARMANKEDGCKGRFWEGRFDSQALLDEAGVLKCMAYVDLNPIRAQLAKTPEESDYTSIQARIKGSDERLAPLADQSATGFCVPISRKDYLTLVDWTGRQIRRGKRGRIAAALPPIIARLAASSVRPWLEDMRDLTRHYVRAIGDVASLQAYRDRLGQTKLKGLLS